VPVNNVGFMVDTKLRTPYSTSFDFSFSRSFPHALTVETAYVGRVARKLLVQSDYAAPLVNFRDRQSGQTWTQAARIIGNLIQQNAPVDQVQPIPFFENVFAPIGGAGATATQAFYSLMQIFYPSWTDALHYLDTSTPEGSTIFGAHTFFHQQFDWVPTWTNQGQSSYHAFQLIVRKRFETGLLFDFNYTLSRSKDNGSALE